MLISGALLVNLIADPAAAQVNVEPLTDFKKDDGWGFDGQARFGLATGNVVLFDLSADAAVRWTREFEEDERPNDEGRWFRDRMIVFGNYGFRTFGSGDDATVVLDSKFVHARYTHMFRPRVGFDVFSQIGNDVVLLLDWRAIAGGGVRLVWSDNDRERLWAGTGYMLEYEDRDAGVEPEIVYNHRWSTYISFELSVIPGRLSILSTTYIQPRLDALGDVQFLEEGKLRIKVNDALAFGIEGRLRIDTQPPAGLEPTDVRVTNTMEIHL